MGPLVLRLVLAAVFLQAGLGKFVDHGAYIERFERWGFGDMAGEAALLTGVVEVAGGALLAVGVAIRPAAAVLAGAMAGALATAGRIDGGRDVWLPLVLLALLALCATVGPGRLALGRTPASG